MEAIEILMDIKEILYIIAVCVVGLYAVISTAVAIVRKIRNKKQNGEDITLSSVIQEVTGEVVDIVNETETLFKSMTGATGIKAGPLKLDSVLNKTRDICAEKQIPFDKEKWTDFIEKTVKLLNNGRENTEKPTETVAEKQTTVV